MAEEPDYDDPEVEEAWCDERRAGVCEYLRGQGVAHGRIGEWPAWHIAPHVSVWAIESGKTPGAIGWWVISGDLPSDYITGNDAEDPRQALRAFAGRWQEAAERMSEGSCPAEIEIGRTLNERKPLAPLLHSRATLLADWAERDELWVDVIDED